MEPVYCNNMKLPILIVYYSPNSKKKPKIEENEFFAIVTMLSIYFLSLFLSPKNNHKNTMVSPYTLTPKDLEKLKAVHKAVSENTACSYDKDTCMQYLESILEPRCMVCRKPLSGEVDIEIINDKKMHVKCRKHYRG